MNAVLLLMGLGLVGGSGQPPAGEGSSPPLPAPVRAPEPLPELQAAGLPPPGAGPTTALRNLAEPPLAPPPPVYPPAPPPRPPAFRLVKPNPVQESSSLRPGGLTSVPAPPPAGPAAVCPPMVTVDKSGPAAARAGEPFTYDIVLRNAGPTPAARVLLEDDLPPGTRVLGARPLPQVQGTRLFWQVEGLPPGGEARFRVEVQPPAAGAWEGTTTVMVSAARTLRVAVGPAAPAPAPAPAPVPETPLTLELRGPLQPVVAGHPVSFAVRVGNRGASPLTGVTLRAHLPPELEHLYGGDIELSLDPLRAGESRTETLEVIAERPGRHVAEVSVKAAGARPVAARAEVAVVEGRVLQLRLLGPRVGRTDREHDFRVEVTNRSPTELRDVLVVERLPPGMALVSGSAGGTYDRGTRSVTWRVGSLAPGQARVVALRVLPRATGPALNEVVARTGQGHQARLQTVLRFGEQGLRGGRSP